MGKSGFENFWFSEIRGSSRTKMSLNSFLYLVKKILNIMSGGMASFGQGVATLMIGRGLNGYYQFLGQFFDH